jgi:hypothetical protein
MFRGWIMLSRSLRVFVTAVLLGLLAGPSAAADFNLHGILEVVGAERGEAFEHNRYFRGDSPFDAYGVRLMGDVRVNDRVQVFSQFILRDATTPYIDGAYAIFTPWTGRDFSVLAGKIPWAIGTFAPRTYSNRNPLVGTPLMYQHHTSLVWYEMPGDADALFGAAGTGQYGVDYQGYAMTRGMALVDDSYWDVGATITGSQRPFEYAVSVVNGTPGWGCTSQDENGGKCALGRVGLTPLPGLRFGVSGAYGPYLHRNAGGSVPAGRSVTDYNQILGMADLEVLAGHFELRAEGALNTWETPTVGDLDVRSGYVEIKHALPFSTFAAGRFDLMRFGSIADSTGASRRWDDDVTRIETGLGYRFDRNVVSKVVYQQTTLDRSAGGTRRLDLWAAQLSVTF